MLKSPAGSNLEREPQPENSYALYKRYEKNFGSPIKFSNDPSSLSYPSDQNRLVESEPFKRKLTMDDVVFMENEVAKSHRGRIKNLVLAVNSQSTVSALLANKHRLSRESTTLFTQKGMGIMEEVNKQGFPDPKTRLTYIPSIFSHAVWHSSIPQGNPGLTTDLDLTSIFMR